jgi:LPXTG-motif cell wall-anchored protein
VFPATLTRNHGHIRRILIVALAALMLFAVLIITPGGTQPAFAAQDGSYTFTFEHTGGSTTTVPATGMRAFADGWNVVIPDAGGTSATIPTGMTVHMSCSDTFPGGWGSEGGPDSVLDSEWRVVSYYIDKVQGDPCGTPPPTVPPELTLIKNVDNTGGGDADASEWTLTAAGTPGDISGNGAPATGIVATLGPNPVTADVEYTLSESGGPANYIEGSWSCSTDGGNPVAGDTITLQNGESGVCEITNTYDPQEPVPPTLKLIKIVEGDGPAVVSDWMLEADATDDPKSFSYAGGIETAMPVTANISYTLSEYENPAAVPGATDNYVAGSWSCVIDQGNEVVGNTITLQNGESGVCEVTNTHESDQATLTLVKTVEGGTLTAGDFPVFLNGEPNQGPVVWGTTYPLLDGTYTAWEIVQPDYTTEGWGGDCDAVGNVTLVAGNDYTCTITNTYVPPFVPNPGIHIEKETNGHDADAAKGPYLVVGSTVTWTYVVTNPGDVALADIKVTDNMGVNPVYQGGDTNTDGLLDVTETWTYKATGTATAGQYANIGFVTGFYQQGEKQVAAEDPSHYWGYIPPPVDPDTPRIDIEKATNGVDADLPTGPSVPVGSTVTWTYVVTNTGNVPLTDVKVTDDKLGAITCPKTTLIILEEMTCTATGTAQLVNYANLGTVVGSYGSVTVTDKDPSHYSGVAVKGTAQLGDTVWLDVNKNGVQDNGEVGYNGADVILKDADGNVVATLTTATGAWVGFYKFLELDAGVYTAMLDLSTIGTYKVSTASAFTITLAEGDDYLDADFGLYEETVPPTTTVPPEETLPTTGADSEGLALLAVGLFMLGGLAILATRKRRTTD